MINVCKTYKTLIYQGLQRFFKLWITVFITKNHQLMI